MRTSTIERRGAGVSRAIVVCALLLAVVSPLEAQRGDRGGAHSAVEIHLVGTQPLGDFDEFVDVGYGAELGLRFPLDRTGAFNLRLEGGIVQYGREKQEVCFSQTVGCRVVVDLNTSNHIIHGAIGPEIAVPTGAVRPYLNLVAGVGYFQTTSSLSGDNDFDPFVGSENFGDTSFLLRTGGGLRFLVSQGRPVSIDLGARYNRNGTVNYLTEGSIVDEPDGSITIFPIRSEANYMSYSVGVSIGFGGGDDRDRDRRRGRRGR